ncbi:hypothetical protein FKY77_00180 [Enterococcus faecium]|nr:hypothetical protein EQ848_06835 [Enterococcus faecium]TNX30333.1 hypothetical protein FIU40_01970 [Enterococcus faecium]TQA59266.1 hypothetical protein FKY77_00180 [Enterococcus faecium]TQA64107.1 hypothetical protein FKY87_01250 [Enterococcus faecium]TQA84925.1 hypothetical protein FKY82_01275 [Enterococcus faecium]
MSLPFHSESQGSISKNSFSCLLNIVTCGRGVGRRTPFIQKKGTATRLLSQSLILNKQCSRDSLSAIRLNVSFTTTSSSDYYRIDKHFDSLW